MRCFLRITRWGKKMNPNPKEEVMWDIGLGIGEWWMEVLCKLNRILIHRSITIRISFCMNMIVGSSFRFDWARARFFLYISLLRFLISIQCIWKVTLKSNHSLCFLYFCYGFNSWGSVFLFRILKWRWKSITAYTIWGDFKFVISTQTKTQRYNAITERT